MLIIVKECGEILINCQNCLFGTKSFLTRLQCTNTTSTDSNFGVFSPSLSLSMSFFPLLNNITVSISELTILICSLFLF